MIKTTAIEKTIVSQPFEGIIFSDDLLVDNFCNWVLDEMHQDQTKSYSAKELATKFNITGNDLNAVIDVLKEKDLIHTSFNSANELELTLTWAGRSYMNSKFEMPGAQLSSIFSSSKKKTATSTVIATICAIAVVVAIILYFILK